MVRVSGVPDYRSRMATFSPAQYDALERAIADRRRIEVRRQAAHDLVVVPRSLRLVDGRERIDAVHPTTGDRLDLWVDELVGFDVVR
ncbi:hypothetical protein tb265_30110 [Gemmatimonadetes bacterium T265]|nr:hypothetical protein tb265_30110 [Gemmatimonadetes bacterium T265]